MRVALENQCNSVVFLGQQVMEPHWHRIDLLCITSVFEGLPLAALEAMSRGIPVCSFAIGDLPDLIDHGHNGWIVPPGDLAAMARCIKHWLGLTTEQRQGMQLNAYQTIQQRYSVQAVVPRIIEHYQQIAA